MDELLPFSPLQTPTVERPLMGQTILIVEDSLFACEALRMMALRSGARIRRADCLATAHRHLKVYRPSIAIIDLGLPDGSGAELIEELACMSPRLPVLLGTSGDDFSETLAIAAGADGFLAKPVASLAVFQEAILAHLPSELHPPGMRLLPVDQITPDPMSLRDDLAHAAEALAAASHDSDLAYVSQFLRGIARSAEDSGLIAAATAVDPAIPPMTSQSDAVQKLQNALRSRLSHMSAI